MSYDCGAPSAITCSVDPVREVDDEVDDEAMVDDFMSGYIH